MTATVSKPNRNTSRRTPGRHYRRNRVRGMGRHPKRRYLARWHFRDHVGENKPRSQHR